MHRHLGLALAIISTAQLMVVLDATIVNIALPSIRRELHFSPVSLEWVINGYALAFGGLLLLGGRAGDLFGRRRMFIVGVGLFTLASLLGGFATNESWLITTRVLQGVGGAIASPTALSLITSTFPEGPARNRAMGVYAAMSGAGSSIGLLLGGILTDVASWRWVLFVNVPIGLAVALIAPRVLGETESHPGHLDLPGAFSVTGGMTLLVYGLTHAATTSWSNGLTVTTLAVAVALLAAFVAIEARSPHAIMPLHIFANRNRSGSYVMMLVIGAALFSMFFFLTQFVQNVMGFSPLKAGVVFLPVSAAIAVVAGLTARMIARTGPRPPMTVGPLVAAGGLFWLSHVQADSTYVGGVLGPIIVIAVGIGVTFVPLTLTAVSGVRRDEAGLASALLNTGQQIGGSLGLAVLVTVATAVIKDRLTSATHPAGTAVTSAGSAARHALNVATTAGYDRAFLVGAFVALAGFVVAVVTIRVRKSDIPSGVAPGPV
ncbi:MAG TPA: MFS transporter [Acidimicrobiales bacterium]|nr:MFS transporter [Acidimicrobiales bacterium]